MMKQENGAIVRRLAGLSVSALAVLAFAVPAFAQEIQVAQAGPAPAAKAAAAKQTVDKPPVEEVLVTGSRISRSNLNQPNPISVTTSEIIKLTGLTTVGDLINQLPQTQNNMTPSTSQRFVNGSGFEFVNLRGLGEYRTLTVVDGIRHVGSLSGRNGNGGTSLVDLASIAPSLIDHVDVVTGGASAVYGADAVAGVVNVVMKKRYEGATLDYQHKFREDGGFETNTINGLIGTSINNDRGNILFAFSYNEDSGLYGRDDSVALCQRTLVVNPNANAANPNAPARLSVGCNQSSTTAANGAVVIRQKLGANNALTLAVSPDGKSLVPFNRGTRLDPGNGSTVGDAVAIGGDGVIANQYIALRAPSKRHIENIVFDYNIARGVGVVRNIDVFADVKYSDVQGQIQNTPSSNGTGSAGDGVVNNVTGGLPIKIDNPYLPAGLATLMNSAGVAAITGTRLNEDWFGRRVNYNQTQVFRSVMGFRGELSNDWKYQLYYNYGRNQGNFGNNTVLTQNWAAAVDAVRLPDGTIGCRSASARAAGCLAVNPFVVGKLTPEQRAYFMSRTFQTTTVTQNNAGANLNGDLFSFANPITKTVAPVGFAMGVEYRKEFTNDQTDALLNLPNPNQISTNVLGTLGKAGYNVIEGFGELSLPVLRDLPFVKAFDIDLAGRYSSYSSTGMAQTWNVLGSWTVNESVRFRGGLSRSVRSPNVDDLYTPASPSFVSISDPCDLSQINNGASARVGNCRAAGIPVGFRASDFSNPYLLVGGNPNLKNEVGNATTLGAIFTPSFAPDFSFTADYWLEKISKGQQQVDPSVALIRCYDQNISVFCGLVHRRPDGSLDHVDGVSANVGKEKVTGVDISLKYNFDLSKVKMSQYGSITFVADISYTPQHYVLQDPADLTTKAYIGGAVGFPKLRGRLQTSWNWDDLTVSLVNRMVGESETFPNQANFSSRPVADFNKIPAFWYHDLSARYNWRNFTFTGGIGNLTGLRAPEVPVLYTGSNIGGGISGLYPVTQSASGGVGVYDALGRTFFFGVKVAL